MARVVVSVPHRTALDTRSQRIGAFAFGICLGLNNSDLAADDQEDYYLWVFSDNLEQAALDASLQSGLLNEDYAP